MFYVLSKGKKNLDAVRLALSVENLLSGWLLKGWEVCFKSRGRKSQEEAEVVEVLKPKGRANNSVFLPLFVSRNRLNNRATGENDQEKWPPSEPRMYQRPSDLILRWRLTSKRVLLPAGLAILPPKGRTPILEGRILPVAGLFVPPWGLGFRPSNKV